MDGNVALSQVVIAYLTSRFIEKLKQWSGLPVVTATSDKINRVLGAIFAALASVGIGFAADWNAETHTWTLVVSGLSWWALVQLGWSWAQQFVLQQMMYHGVIKEKKEGA